MIICALLRNNIIGPTPLTITRHHRHAQFK